MHDEALGGLSSAEASRRLGAHGPNALPDAERHGWWHTLKEVLTEPMFVLLLASAGLYLVLGDWGEGLLLSGFALLTVALVVVQGRRREHALRALRDMAVPMVRVHRDGQWGQCRASEVVCGDWVMLSEGDRVAADAVVRRATGLRVDEALLTGESWPVDKWSAPPDPPQDAPRPSTVLSADRVWAGTLVVSGHGVAEVVAIGANTRMGGIGQALSDIKPLPTPLEQQVRTLVRTFGALAAAAMLLVVLWWGMRQHDWVGGVLSALSLGMGMLPEEFPMALAVFMSMGAWRLSRLHVLARRPAAIEALGTTTLLCVDKTGTLTENRLRLVTAWPIDSAHQHEPDNPTAPTAPTVARARLLEAAMLASRRTAVDPIDRALAEAVEHDQASASATALHLIRDWPVQAGRPMTMRWWQCDDGSGWLVAKGAPEFLALRCQGGEKALRDPLQRASELAAQGLRVLAVAQLRWSPTQAEATGTAAGARPEPPDLPWQWMGLLAFEDPLRPTVPQAVQRATEAGIAVCLITGDHAQTALSIARQAGIDTQAGVMEGPAFEALDPAQQREAVQRIRVFARVSPLTKLLLVQRAQAAGHVVAMTGDGVNDAPALKAAHIGVAMGRRGTDVAREASALVLMREDFSHLVAAIEQGRTVFDNLRQVSGYIVSIHVPLVGLAVMPMVWGWPPLMTPAHVVLTEMLIDPMCSLAFEAAPPASNVMRRPPRVAGEGLLDHQALARCVALGLALLITLVCVWWVVRTLQPNGSIEQQRTWVMSGLLAGNLTLVALQLGGGGWLRLRGGSAAKIFGVAAVVALAGWAVGLAWPALGHLLQLEPVAPSWLLAVMALTSVVLVAVQVWLLKR